MSEDIGERINFINNQRRMFLSERLDSRELRVLKNSYFDVYRIAVRAQDKATSFDELFEAIQDIVIEIEEAGFFEGFEAL
tara:strand:+ start:516 stop:755 length:240 start_codon:yes stop_codon:yes gene_type:complete